MTAHRRKKKNRDSIGAGGQYPLWPDENGLVNPPLFSHAQLNVSQLQHLPRSPRAEKRRALRLLRSRSFSSWLLSKNLVVVGFGVVRRRIFDQWLSALLENSDFGAVSVSHAIGVAVADLGLDREEVIRLLARATADHGDFKSDGVIVMAR